MMQSISWVCQDSWSLFLIWKLIQLCHFVTYLWNNPRIIISTTCYAFIIIIIVLLRFNFSVKIPISWRIYNTIIFYASDYNDPSSSCLPQHRTLLTSSLASISAFNSCWWIFMQLDTATSNNPSNLLGNPDPKSAFNLDLGISESYLLLVLQCFDAIHYAHILWIDEMIRDGLDVWCKGIRQDERKRD